MIPIALIASRLRAVHSNWRSVDGAALVLRAVLGLVFVAHGAAKLFGPFGKPFDGGGGIPGTTAFFKSIGIPIPHFFAVFVGLTEFCGGILLIAGVLTVAASLALIGDMVVAMATSTLGHGFFVEKPYGGWEINLLALGLLGSLVLIGGGAWSIDRALGLARADSSAEPPPAPPAARFTPAPRRVGAGVE